MIEKFPQQIPTCTVLPELTRPGYHATITREIRLQILAQDLLSCLGRVPSHQSAFRPLAPLCTQCAAAARGAETSASLPGHPECRTKQRAEQTLPVDPKREALSLNYSEASTIERGRAFERNNQLARALRRHDDVRHFRGGNI